MNYFITGGAGFIGSHLVDALSLNQDNKITIYDNLYQGKLKNIGHHIDNPNIKIVNGDIRSYTDLPSNMIGHDIVFHLSAQSNVGGSVKDPNYSFTTNVDGIFNTLLAAKNNKIKKFIFSSSREVYGDPFSFPVDEDHPFNPKNLYGATKASGEIFCNTFRKLHNLDVSILRFSNAYGIRDFRGVIPLWINSILQGKEIFVNGGEQVIDFVHVSIIVQALIKVSKIEYDNNPINIGSGVGTSILDLAKRIQNIMGDKRDILVKPKNDFEVVKFIAKTDRMRNILGIEQPEDSLFALEGIIKSINMEKDFGKN